MEKVRFIRVVMCILLICSSQCQCQQGLINDVLTTTFDIGRKVTNNGIEAIGNFVTPKIDIELDNATGFSKDVIKDQLFDSKLFESALFDPLLQIANKVNEEISDRARGVSPTFRNFTELLNPLHPFTKLVMPIANETLNLLLNNTMNFTDPIESLLDILSTSGNPQLISSRKNITLKHLLETRDFIKQLEETYEKIAEYLKHHHLVTRDFWNCDPQEHKKDYSYSKLQVFQAFITNEQDTQLNACKTFKHCNDMNEYMNESRLTYQKNTVYSQKIAEKLQCNNGHLADCNEMSYSFYYCEAPAKDDRRYLGMYTDKNYGDYNSNCTKHVRDHATRSGFFRCMFCLCTCVSNDLDIDRYFSLKPVVSNILGGMVITGVQLTKVKHVFYIDIQEGQLLANGNIGAVRWRRTPRDKTVDFEKIRQNNPTNRHGDFPKNDEVYAVHWEQKTVFVDDIDATSQFPNKDLVLTGIGFKQEKDALILQVRLSNFDYKTGKITTEGNWYSNNITMEQRTEIPLDKADDPIKKEVSHLIDSHSGQYLKFQVTNLKADMGQSTVPYLDIQEVVAQPPMLLAGAGLYHKGIRSGESGGFLGLKLFRYNHNKHEIVNESQLSA